MAVFRAVTDWPPWSNKAVVPPTGYSSGDIEWVPLSSLVPSQGRATTRSVPTQSERRVYPALITNRTAHTVANANDRYYDLVDGRWRGTVPIVRMRWPV